MHPHVIITDHDRARAAAIFLVIGDYLDNYTESDNNGGHYIYEQEETDFEGYVMELFGYQEYGQATPDELLK
jgi:predicted deacetylase